MAAVPIEQLLSVALDARADFFDARHEQAFRVFNGFLEGCPSLAIDLYARTLVLYNYADAAEESMDAMRPALVDTAWHFLLERLPWVQVVVVKTRSSPDEQARRGLIAYPLAPSGTDRKIQRMLRVREHGVWYAVDLTLNLDASLYLDTRNLRAWEMEHLRGKRVLNTFAYTGSLGVAAMAGGARQVIQLDLNRRFLNLAKDSYALNGFPVRRSDFRAGDFWMQASQLRRAGELFDCVLVDPPFFSTTAGGTVDLLGQSQQVINKVRPLVANNGWLVAINNALFLSGAEYLRVLQDLADTSRQQDAKYPSADGYLSIEELIPVPPDFTGFPETRVSKLPADPAPFNHSTKIAVLRVRRKDERTA